MSRMFRRTRYDVVQIANGHETVLLRNQNRRSAIESAAHSNRTLLLCKLLAPSGPQDAHTIIRTSAEAER